MKFIQMEDGTWVNLAYVQEVDVVENSVTLLEDCSDSHCVLVTRWKMHEEITNIYLTGSEEECQREVRKLTEPQ